MKLTIDLSSAAQRKIPTAMEGHPKEETMMPKIILLAAFLGIAAAPTVASAAQDASITVDGNVALSSLMALGDGHLESMAASLQTLAASSEAQSADWSRIRAPLRLVAGSNVDALLWFARPDGTYWDLMEGKAEGNLATREYFPKVLRGDPVIGDLVVSKATGKSVAIVAVPVRAAGKVVGVLGSSIYLDKLSARIEKEMGLDQTMIFYAFNDEPLLALVWDKELIFKDPTSLGPEIEAAFRKMMRQGEGTISYPFRGQERTVLFRKSRVTGWWYAFGRVPGGRAAND
jgi:hypothetical protein